MLRNSSETAKVIRQIKEILESDAWAKYYCFEDIEKVRLHVIHTLISTNVSWNQIRKELK
jgi:hypothetical protein